MIERFSLKSKDIVSIVEYLKIKNDSEFCYTLNNVRYYINSFSSLKKLLSNSIFNIYLYDKGEVKGVLCLWKGLHDDLKRYYIKIIADDAESYKNLIKYLIWYEGDRELFIKVKNENPYIWVLKSKSLNFKWIHSRGTKQLLKRERINNGFGMVKDNVNIN